ncbi:hypothetical protein BC828DRAFT_216649 [Blastocladiella britannica]|nr:hypothetical protein BC828DRAFT_216649 [Blastocladiella britannica]
MGGFTAAITSDPTGLDPFFTSFLSFEPISFNRPLHLLFVLFLLCARPFICQHPNGLSVVSFCLLLFFNVCGVGSSQVHQVQSRRLLRVRLFLVYLIFSLEHMADMFISFVWVSFCVRSSSSRIWM